MRRVVVVAAFAALLAGCAVPQVADTPEQLDGDSGVVDGVAYDDDIAVTVDDGFNESELDAVVKRSMARIEVIRGLTFEQTVDVEVITREEYRNQRGQRERNETASLWNNQVWEGLFLVGEDRDISEVFNRTYGSAVQGYYSSQDEQIVIVSDSETPTISKSTLVHELVHALQDQRFGLDEAPDTQDTQMARNSVVEGEANLVPRQYFQRCNSEWSCIRPADNGSSGGVDPGVYLVIIEPYQAGPTFVEHVRGEEGWDGVDDLHSEYPASTEQVIHPSKYPDETPVNVTVPDRSSEDWSRFAHDPVGDTLGEASIYAMFQHNGLIETDSQFSYDHPVSSGWGGDTLVPYRNGDGEFGYVWETEWDSADDAELFYETYLELLDRQGAQERGQRSFVIPEGPFADAYRVTLDGQTVRIVNGPDVDSLSEIDESG